MRGSDAAYDPAHDVYLMVVGNGAVFGVFVNSSGQAVTEVFAIMDGSMGWGHFPRAEYSPHVPNGMGGQGGFLVTWHHPFGAPPLNYVFGRIVSYTAPGRVVSPIQQFSDAGENGSWWETGPALAYSRNSHRFLVAWRTLGFGVRGRFVDTNGNAIGVVMQLENPGNSRDPALTWNPGTDEFGLVSTGFGGSGAFARFRRIRASDGAHLGATSFGFTAGTFATGIDVNTWNYDYVMTWALHPGTMSATFDKHGTHLASNFITGRFGHDQSMGLAFNPASGTFLAVGSDHFSLEIAGVEIKNGGAPNSTATVVTNGAALGSFYPLVASRTGTNNWNIAYSRDFRGATAQIMATTSTGGGTPGGPPPGGPPPPPPPPPPGGCTTPDPFASLGGGTCQNGGWLPPGSVPPPAPPPPAPPPPSPPPPSGGCTTPAPAPGWVCQNGGWLPPGFPGLAPPPPPPPPPPASSGCTTPAPGPSWVCQGGGWLPPGFPGLAPPAPPPPSCPTPDPFTSIGGGICKDGGWVPRIGSCTTPDPFTSIGGGVCIEGGWVPRGSGAP